MWGKQLRQITKMAFFSTKTRTEILNLLFLVITTIFFFQNLHSNSPFYKHIVTQRRSMSQQYKTYITSLEVSKTFIYFNERRILL